MITRRHRGMPGKQSLQLPEGCTLVAGSFLSFFPSTEMLQSQSAGVVQNVNSESNTNIPYMLQTNLSAYMWPGMRRSACMELILERYGWSHTHIVRVGSTMVAPSQWQTLRTILSAALQLLRPRQEFDEFFDCNKVNWLNLIRCDHAYEIMRRQCLHINQLSSFPAAADLAYYLRQKVGATDIKPWPLQLTANSDVCSMLNATLPSPPISPPLTSSANSGISMACDESRCDSPTAESLCEVEKSIAHKMNISSTETSMKRNAAILDDNACSWLSDIQIANISDLLVRSCLQLNSDVLDKLQFTYPMPDSTFLQMLRAPPKNHRDRLPLLLQAKNGEIVTGCFINQRGLHWRLAIVDGLHKQVVLFDPLGHAFSAYFVRVISKFTGATFRIIDLATHVQSEGYNCGIWCCHVAGLYAQAVSESSLFKAVTRSRRRGAGYASFTSTTYQLDFSAVLSQQSNDFVILPPSLLEANSHDLTVNANAMRRKNQEFADSMRSAYRGMLVEAEQNSTLPFTTDIIASNLDNNEGLTHIDDDSDGVIVVKQEKDGQMWTDTTSKTLHVERAFIDLTEDMEHELEELEWEEKSERKGVDPYADLNDNYIEFREDNETVQSAGKLKYSLPAKHQSSVLIQQLESFRHYRRERFSLFRKGPLVEQTTIASNIDCLLRFLGYVFYYHRDALGISEVDMSIFERQDAGTILLKYVEWLGGRNGQARKSDDFQPVRYSTCANYINKLVSVVKYHLREPSFQLHGEQLLEQMRNLRGQLETYATSEKKFERIHPDWIEWSEIQQARQRCLNAFQATQHDASNKQKYNKQLKELCIILCYSIIPPTRCSIIRQLEWDKTLVYSSKDERYIIQLTDRNHAATKHKTHKRKGPMILPLPKLLTPYLNQLRSIRSNETTRSCVFSQERTDKFLDISSFTCFVKSAFANYTTNGAAPNPSLLRSIFTTWLYSLKYDLEDSFLQEVKATSALWKAHSEEIASTVYNAEVTYQKKRFLQMLTFCELYAAKFTHAIHATLDVETQSKKQKQLAQKPQTKSSTTNKRPRGQTNKTKKTKRRNTLPLSQSPTSTTSSPSTSAMDSSDELENHHSTSQQYVVEELCEIAMRTGEKMILVKWEGYKRKTWEPYHHLKQQLPDMVKKREQKTTVMLDSC